VTHVAWRSQPPDEAAEPKDEAAQPKDGAPSEDAEVVDLTKQRFLGWVKGMFGGGKTPPPEDD
jgi:hypothetical protein